MMQQTRSSPVAEKWRDALDHKTEDSNKNVFNQ